MASHLLLDVADKRASSFTPTFSDCCTERIHDVIAVPAARPAASMTSVLGKGGYFPPTSRIDAARIRDLFSSRFRLLSGRGRYDRLLSLRGPSRSFCSRIHSNPSFVLVRKLNDRVIAPIVPRMAADDALGTHPTSSEDSIPGDSLIGIL